MIKIGAIAAGLLRIASVIAPARRRVWIEAIVSECEFVPPNEQISFAWGGLVSAVTERIRYMINHRDILFLPAIIATFLVALLAFAHSVRLFFDDPMVTVTFFAIGLYWSVAALVFLFHARVGVKRIAIGGFAIYAALGIASLTGLPSMMTNASLYRALAIEGIGMTLVLLAFAQFAPIWTHGDASSSGLGN